MPFSHNKHFPFFSHLSLSGIGWHLFWKCVRHYRPTSRMGNTYCPFHLLRPLLKCRGNYHEKGNFQHVCSSTCSLPCLNTFLTFKPFFLPSGSSEDPTNSSGNGFLVLIPKSSWTVRWAWNLDAFFFLDLNEDVFEIASQLFEMLTDGHFKGLFV